MSAWQMHPIMRQKGVSRVMEGGKTSQATLDIKSNDQVIIRRSLNEQAIKAAAASALAGVVREPQQLFLV